MNVHDQKQIPPRVANPQGNFHEDKLPDEDILENDVSSNAAASWVTDIEHTLQLGEQLMGAVSGIVDLARVEALLAVRTLPKLMMLWILIMPIILLTWCAFSALLAWSVFAASEEVGLGMLTFFLQQVVLLLACRWLYVKYRTRMILPYTRAQIDNFLRSTQDGFKGGNQKKE
jgi:uncharacterized membrane protein YqjE